MVALTWVVAIVVAVLGVLPSPAQIPRKRFALALVGFLVLTAAFLIYGFVIAEEFPSIAQMVLVVVAISLAAALGYLFGAGGAALITGVNRRVPGVGGKVLFVLLAVILGGLFFLSASYLAAQHINTGYLTNLKELFED